MTEQAHFNPEMIQSIREEYMPRPARELYEIGPEHIPAAQGFIYRAVYKKDGHPVAIKFTPPTLDREGQQWTIKEIHLACNKLLEVSSPYVVPYEDVVVDEEYGIGLVTPWMEGGDLFDQIKQTSLRWDLASSYAIQIALGLDAIHKVGVFHRDLKPENIFVGKTTDEFPRCAIADFGISVPAEYIGKKKTYTSPNQRGEMAIVDPWARRDTLVRKTKGTPGFMSPEQALDVDDITYASDYFSLGTIMYTLLSGTKPFGTVVDVAHKRTPWLAVPMEPEPIKRDAQDNLRDIVLALLDKNTTTRGVLDNTIMYTGAQIAHQIALCWKDSKSGITQTPWFREAMGEARI